MLSGYSIASGQISESWGYWATATETLPRVVVSSSESAIVGYPTDYATLTISTSDVGTLLAVDVAEVDISSFDSGSVSHLAKDSATVTVNTLDANGILTITGYDLAVINPVFAEKRGTVSKLSSGSDSIAVTVSFMDAVTLGDDSAIVVISASDQGVSTLFNPLATATSICVNMATSGVSQYSNYRFNSFFRIGNSYYGCGVDGIYRLSGDQDSTTDIDAYVTTGVTDFGTKTHIHDAYILARSQGDMELQTIVEENMEIEPYAVSYIDDHDGMRRQRIKLGKGVKGNTWQFKISNVAGADFTLKQLEILPVKTQRIGGI